MLFFERGSRYTKRVVLCRRRPPLRARQNPSGTRYYADIIARRVVTAHAAADTAAALPLLMLLMLPPGVAECWCQYFSVCCFYAADALPRFSSPPPYLIAQHHQIRRRQPTDCEQRGAALRSRAERMAQEAHDAEAVMRAAHASIYSLQQSARPARCASGYSCFEAAAQGAARGLLLRGRGECPEARVRHRALFRRSSARFILLPSVDAAIFQRA